MINMELFLQIDLEKFCDKKLTTTNINLVISLDCQIFKASGLKTKPLR